MKLESAARQALSEIEQHKAVRQQSFVAAAHTFKEKTQEHYRVLEALEAQYSEIAFDFACSQGKPPFSPNGQRQQPTTVHVEPEGILLIWDISDQDYRSHLVPWSELEVVASSSEAEN